MPGVESYTESSKERASGVSFSITASSAMLRSLLSVVNKQNEKEEEKGGREAQKKREGERGTEQRTRTPLMGNHSVVAVVGLFNIDTLNQSITPSYS